MLAGLDQLPDLSGFRAGCVGRASNGNLGATPHHTMSSAAALMVAICRRLSRSIGATGAATTGAAGAPACETHPFFRFVFASAAFLSHAVGGGGGAAGASGTGETSSSETPPPSELERSSQIGLRRLFRAQHTCHHGQDKDPDRPDLQPATTDEETVPR